MPVKIEAVWQSDNRSLASKLEYRIKKLSKTDKELLVSNPKIIEELLEEQIQTQLYNLVKMLSK